MSCGGMRRRVESARGVCRPRMGVCRPAVHVVSGSTLRDIVVSSGYDRSDSTSDVTSDI